MQTNNTLNIHSIESFGTHDGPGIRLVLFLQGCNIKCQYCHNPDTIQNHKSIITSIDSLLEKAIKMKPYFGENGGVTVSGGEPLLQAKELISFFKALQKENIHTNIDTNGTISTIESNELLSKISDLVMFDIKGTNEHVFESITGSQKLATVLQNINLREESKKPYWLRYVLVPTITDSKESVQWLIRTFEKKQYLTKFEILPYHTMGMHKWGKLGWTYSLQNIIEHSEEEVEHVKNMLSKYLPIF